MSNNIDRMRENFNHAAVRLGWTPQDVAEFNADIKAAIHSGDVDRLTWWNNRLGELSNLTALAKACRAMEARIKAEAAERAAA